MTQTQTPEMREADWNAAVAEARAAIYDDGRGMIGRRNRDQLENRVARAILHARRDERAVALSAPSPVVEGQEDQGSSVAESGGTTMSKSEGPNSAGWEPTHRHVKRGSLYRITGGAKLQTENPCPDEAFLIVYQDEKGLLWARPGSEFYDGRFEPFSAEKGISSPTEGRAGILAGDEPPSSSPPQATNSEVEIDEGEAAEAIERAWTECSVGVGLPSAAFNMVGRHFVHHLKDVQREFAEKRAALAQQDPNP